jgi:hypothetical protein
MSTNNKILKYGKSIIFKGQHGASSGKINSYLGGECDLYLIETREGGLLVIASEQILVK